MSIDPDGLFTKMFPEVWTMMDPEDAEVACQELGIPLEDLVNSSGSEINGRLAAHRTLLIVRAALQQKKLMEERWAVEERRAHR